MTGSHLLLKRGDIVVNIRGKYQGFLRLCLSFAFALVCVLCVSGNAYANEDHFYL